MSSRVAKELEHDEVNAKREEEEREHREQLPADDLSSSGLVKNPGPEPSQPDYLTHDPPQSVYAQPRDDAELMHPGSAEMSAPARNKPG